MLKRQQQLSTVETTPLFIEALLTLEMVEQFTSVDEAADMSEECL